MMNSKLEVDSVYGVGSTFSFDLKQKIFSTEEIGDFKEKIKKIATENIENIKNSNRRDFRF